MKPQILTRPGYAPIGESTVILNGDLIFENDNFKIIVCKNFITDGGSLPRLSWTILGITPFSPSCVYSFFLHDFLYCSELLTRKQADDILYECLAIAPACNLAQRWLIWSHVRAYGWMVWASHTAETIEQGRKFGEVVIKVKLNKSVLK